ncbi:hypothetical protein HUT16_17695 [Kitasatospora sp. NA04385]|uniref:hypothetical protein n=1 Tax=Kitasatospora sp. NA04385 TaxID=2742135 RepID=UPI00158FFC50|nr:hypothetical protein [Kitasatospora sp. NA04385]QKW20658.1 hypothetical protein HUT16_17695 [Kitasatospora sp. NA04385]
MKQAKILRSSPHARSHGADGAAEIGIATGAIKICIASYALEHWLQEMLQQGNDLRGGSSAVMDAYLLPASHTRRPTSEPVDFVPVIPTGQVVVLLEKWRWGHAQSLTARQLASASWLLLPSVIVKIAIASPLPVCGWETEPLTMACGVTRLTTPLVPRPPSASAARHLGQQLALAA